MKKQLATAAIAAALALSLAACGADRNDRMDLLPDPDGTGDTWSDGRNADSVRPEDTGRDGGADTGMGFTEGVTGAVNRSGRRSYDGERAAEAAGDRYALMLENGRVHDSDGFLLDGENAHYQVY